MLTTAGDPAGEQPAIASAVRACLHDRVAEDDTDVQPASCASLGENPAMIVQDSFRDAAV